MHLLWQLAYQIHHTDFSCACVVGMGDTRIFDSIQYSILSYKVLILYDTIQHDSQPTGMEVFGAKSALDSLIKMLKKAATLHL